MARRRKSKTSRKKAQDAIISKGYAAVPNAAAELRTFLRNVAKTLFGNRVNLMKGIRQISPKETDAEVMFARKYITAPVLEPLLGQNASIIANNVHTVIDDIWYHKSNQKNCKSNQKKLFKGASAAAQLYDSMHPETKDILKKQRISSEAAEARAAPSAPAEISFRGTYQAGVEEDLQALACDGFYGNPVYYEKNTMQTMHHEETSQSVASMDDFAEFANSLAHSAPITSLSELLAPPASTIGN